MENIEEKRVDMISKWEEKSRDFIDAFLLLFGREGRLVRRKKILTIIFIMVQVFVVFSGFLISRKYTRKNN